MNKVFVLGANSFSGQDFVDLLLDDPAYDGDRRQPLGRALGAVPEVSDADRPVALPLSRGST